MTRLLFIRHGAIDGLGRRIAGRGGHEALNASGRLQAAQLAEHLRAQALTAIYSSPQSRTLETAQAIAQVAGAPLHIEANLDELDFGAWTGMDYGALDHLPEWRAFNQWRSCTRIPNGEMIVEVQSRIVACAERLCRSHPDQTIALVSHGDVIRAGLAYYLGAPLEFIQRFEISPASVSIVELDNGAPRILGINGKIDNERSANG